MRKMFRYLYGTLTLTAIFYNLLTLHGFKEFQTQTTITNACYALMLMLLSHKIVKRYKKTTILRRWHFNLAKILLFFMNKVDDVNMRIALTITYCIVLTFICVIITTK